MDNVPWQLSLQILPWDTDNQTHNDFVPPMFHHCCCSEVSIRMSRANLVLKLRFDVERAIQRCQDLTILLLKPLHAGGVF